MEALEGPASAALQAIARAAANRLARGVWTSPGAGDIRRAIAACERLVLLVDGGAADSNGGSVTGSVTGDAAYAEAPWERRDLAVMYYLNGQPSRAKAELSRYVSSGGAQKRDPRDAVLVDRLMDTLADVCKFAPDDDALTLASALKQQPPSPEEEAVLPLTW